jgi:glutamate/tyrosine decarboxylase-like PLP-dependent enzyme
MATGPRRLAAQRERDRLEARRLRASELCRRCAPGLNVVCFRYRPTHLSEPELNDVNRRLGEALLDDGRVFAGTIVYGGRVALRPAISNWRTTAADFDHFVDIIRELGANAARGR